MGARSFRLTVNTKLAPDQFRRTLAVGDEVEILL
jgi:hypothetical protein